MPAYVWIGLAVLLLALLGGGAFAVVRGRDTWRAFKRLNAEIDAATGPLLESVARAEKKAAELESAGPRMRRSVERLRESIEVLRIELAVLQEARAPLMRLRALAVLRR